MNARTMYTQGYTLKQISEKTGMSQMKLQGIVKDLIAERRPPESNWPRGPKPVNLLGKVYGKLTINEYISRIKSREYMIKCKCSCGNEVELKSKDVTLGKITSCGCEPQPVNGPVMIGEQTLYQYSQEHNIHYNVLLKKLLDGETLK